MYGSDDEMAQALKSIFLGQGIKDIQIMDSGPIEIVPVEEGQ